MGPARPDLPWKHTRQGNRETHGLGTCQTDTMLYALSRTLGHVFIQVCKACFLKELRQAELSEGGLLPESPIKPVLRGGAGESSCRLSPPGR